MTRQLALIEGDLTVPLLRPYDGLPPPFGARPDMMREGVKRTVSEPTETAAASKLPPGVRHVLFYKVPPRPVDTRPYDAALAEAKRYLEITNVPRRSSRYDRGLSATIFAGCTIALAWLLITCSTKEADKTKALHVTPTVESAGKRRIDQPKAAARMAVAALRAPVDFGKAASQTLAEADRAARAKTANATMPPTSSTQTQVAHASPLLSPPPPRGTPTSPRQPVRRAARIEDAATTLSAKQANWGKVAHLSGNHVNDRIALNRAGHFATRPTASVQPEWTARALSSPNIASIDNAQWLSWPAPQQRTTMRAATPVDNHWADHMTQRRITDDPAAFHADRSGQ
jgi:hypothetical protein